MGKTFRNNKYETYTEEESRKLKKEAKRTREVRKHTHDTYEPVESVTRMPQRTHKAWR